MIFQWSLSNSKSPQVSRILFSILADLNNAIVRTVSSRPVNSKSSNPSTNPFVIILRAPITISIIVTFMFQSFFNCRNLIKAKSTYIFRFSHCFNFFSVVRHDSKGHNPAKSLFFVDCYKIWSSGRD